MLCVSRGCFLIYETCEVVNLPDYVILQTGLFHRRGRIECVMISPGHKPGGGTLTILMM